MCRLPQIIGRGAPHGHVEVWQKWFEVGEPKPETAALFGMWPAIGRYFLANSARASSRVNEPAACERDGAITDASMDPVAGGRSPDLAVVHTTRYQARSEFRGAGAQGAIHIGTVELPGPVI